MYWQVKNEKKKKKKEVIATYLLHLKEYLVYHVFNPFVLPTLYGINILKISCSEYIPLNLFFFI